MNRLLLSLVAATLIVSACSNDSVVTSKGNAFTGVTEILCVDGRKFVFYKVGYGGGLSQMLQADGKPELCEASHVD